MFWNFHFNMSAIETLLAKEDITLIEILEEDDILQECKTPNAKLIDFLTQDEILRELLHLVVDQPADDIEDVKKYKYKNLACEIITLDIYTILDKIASNQEYLDILWSLAELPPPLNPLIARILLCDSTDMAHKKVFFTELLTVHGFVNLAQLLDVLNFFAKIVSILMCRKGQETFEYLRSHDAVNRLIVHIDISAIMELFMKMVTVVETQEIRTQVAMWLDNENLIGKLIDVLRPSEQEEKHYNVSQLLSELICIGRDSISQYVETEDPLLITLEKKETVEKLFNTMFEDGTQAKSDSTILSGIATLSSMMEIKRPVIESAEELITPNDLERIARGVQATLQVLSTKMQCFYDVLTQSQNISQMETTVGLLDPPLGKVRLNIAKLICTAVSTNTKIINDAVAQTGLLSILLDLFARYEWNNFLHTYVQNCIVAILNNETDVSCDGSDTTNSKGTDALLRNLFVECDLINRCLTLWKTNESSEKSGNNRKGYMGHLTIITNEIINAKEKGPNHENIKSMFNELSQDVQDQWNELLSNSLAETNQKNLYSSFSTVTIGRDDSSSDDSELEVYQEDMRFKIDSITGRTIQQSFENYQVQPMTNEFMESFGFDENHVNETGNLKNPFDEVGNVDFSINANEQSGNEKMFEDICEQKIRPFNDSDGETEEEDIWEEKQLTFSSPSQPRQSTDAIQSDSDSDEDSNKSPPVQPEANESESSHRMEVDSENEKSWWTADFSNMDFQNNSSTPTTTPATTEAPTWPGVESNPVAANSTSSEGFADFSDISKFEITNENSEEQINSPVDMETEGSAKPRNISVYEVKMEEDVSTQETSSDSNDLKHQTNEKKSESNASNVTQITVKSVRLPAQQPDFSSSDNETKINTKNEEKEKQDKTSIDIAQPVATVQAAQLPMTQTPLKLVENSLSQNLENTAAPVNEEISVEKNSEQKSLNSGEVILNGPTSTPPQTSPETGTTT